MRMTKNLNLKESLVVGTRSRFLYFVTPNKLNYMQYCLMLLEKCGHNVAKDLATVTWLDENQIHVCLVT